MKAVSNVIGGSGATILKRIKKYFKQVSSGLYLTLSEDGTPSVGLNLDKTEILPAIDDLFNGLYAYTESTNKSAVVVLDEFQQLGELEDDRIEKILRSIIQKHRRLSYIFMGSKKHRIYDMFNNPERPFYRSTQHFPLREIERPVFASFIEKKFKGTEVQLEKGVADAIVDTAESHPYYTQMLAHVVWQTASETGAATLEDVPKGVKKILEREEIAFSNLWDNLTLKQRRLLMAINLKKDQEKMFSVEFIDKHQLGSGSTMQRGIRSLISKNIIDREGEKVRINDIFLKHWLRMRMNP